jgi:hypothetical protein
MFSVIVKFYIFTKHYRSQRTAKDFFELGFCCNATGIATGSAGRAENDEFSLFSKSAKARASRPHSRRTYVHVKLRVQNNCEPEEPVGFERCFSR